MKSFSDYTESEIDQLLKSAMQGKLKGKRTLGFYIQLLLLAGALASMALFGAWKVLWAVFVAVPMMLTTSVKPVFWKWTEARLRADAEGGNVKRAVWWDYLAVVLDWTNDFVCFAMIAWTVFALVRGTAMPTSFKWICVGAISATPFAYQGGDLGYSVWNYMFWYQWSLIATAIVSTFCPISGFQGIAIQIAVALVSIPLTCRFKKAGIVSRVRSYQRNAGMSRASQGSPSGSFEGGGEIYDISVSMLKEVRISRSFFSLSFPSPGGVSPSGSPRTALRAAASNSEREFLKLFRWPSASGSRNCATPLSNASMKTRGAGGMVLTTLRSSSGCQERAVRQRCTRV